MKRIMLALLTGGLAQIVAAGNSTLAPANAFTVQEIRYEGRLAEDVARFTLNITALAAGVGKTPSNCWKATWRCCPANSPTG